MASVSCLRFLAPLAFLAVATPAVAEDWAQAWQPTISATGGTLGFGPEIGIRIPHSAFGLRAQFDVFSYSDDDLYTHHFSNNSPTEGYDIDAHFGGSVRLLNGGLTADYYPLGSGFRLSAGIFINGDRITALATPGASARIGTQTYAVADAGSVSLKALVNEVSPYVGFGYAGRLWGPLVWSADAGILVEGDPRVSMTTEGPAAALPAFTQQVDDERRSIARDLRTPVYPVVQFSVGYRF